MIAKVDRTLRRKQRTRRQLLLRAAGSVRLSVHRSNRYVYAQLIDDSKSCTLASASSLDPLLREKLKNYSNSLAAKEVGRLIAERAKKTGVSAVVFDRGSLAYHGCVKSLADAAREAGLKF
ncbi:MAG: 50S ribosomal protein L18 [Alphaproteobacteria bacterium]|nr:MAG: 50S ribosomal protein L18 [Alphaproteobacteria bacterium]